MVRKMNHKQSLNHCSNTPQCAGCGETPYLKRSRSCCRNGLLDAPNATGLSVKNVRGGNLPSTPYTTNRDGRGPAWSKLALRGQRGVRLRVPDGARRPLRDRARPAADVCAPLASRPGGGDARCRTSDERGRAKQRRRVEALRARLAGLAVPEARRLETLADYLVKKSVWWLVGGNRLGLRHRVRRPRSRARRTGVTSTSSSSTRTRRPGVEIHRTARPRSSPPAPLVGNLGLLANMYGHVSVAKVAFGAKMAQSARAFLEAESYQGPVVDRRLRPLRRLRRRTARRGGASASTPGMWPLYQFDPRRLVKGLLPLKLNYGPPKGKSLTICETNRASEQSNVPNPAFCKLSATHSRPALSYAAVGGWPALPCRYQTAERNQAPPGGSAVDLTPTYPWNASAKSADRRRGTTR